MGSLQILPSRTFSPAPISVATPEPLVTNPYGVMKLPPTGMRTQTPGVTKEAVVAQIAQEAVGTFAALFKGDFKTAVGSILCATAGVTGMLGGAFLGHLVFGSTGSLICSAFAGSILQALAKWGMTAKSSVSAEVIG